MGNASMLGADFTAQIGFVPGADGDLPGGAPASFGAFRRVLDASVLSADGRATGARIAGEDAGDTANPRLVGASTAGDPRGARGGALCDDASGSRPVDAGVSALTGGKGERAPARDMAFAPDDATLPSPAPDSGSEGALEVVLATDLHPGAADRAAADRLLAADDASARATNGARMRDDLGDPSSDRRGSIADTSTRAAGAGEGARDDAKIGEARDDDDRDDAAPSTAAFMASAWQAPLLPNMGDRLPSTGRDPVNAGAEPAANGELGGGRDLSGARQGTSPRGPRADAGANVALGRLTRSGGTAQDRSSAPGLFGGAQDTTHSVSKSNDAAWSPSPNDTIDEGKSAPPGEDARTEQASFGDRQAPFGDRQASFGDRQAPFGDRQASFGDRQASFGEQAPLDEQASFGVPGLPSFGGQEPFGAAGQRSFHGQAPFAAAGQAPSNGQAPFAAAGQAPSNGQAPFGARTHLGAAGQAPSNGQAPFGARAHLGAAGQASSNGQVLFDGQAPFAANKQSAFQEPEQASPQGAGADLGEGRRGSSGLGDSGLGASNGRGGAGDGLRGGRGRGESAAGDAARIASMGADRSPSGGAGSGQSVGGPFGERGAPMTSAADGAGRASNTLSPPSLRGARSLRIPGASLYNASSFGRARPATDEQIRGTLDALPTHDVADEGAALHLGLARGGHRPPSGTMRAVSLPSGAPIGTVEEIEGAFVDRRSLRSPPSVVGSAAGPFPEVRIVDANAEPASLRTPKDRAAATSATMRPPAAPITTEKPASPRRAPSSVAVGSPAERLASSIASRITIPESGGAAGARWTAPSAAERSHAFAEQAPFPGSPSRDGKVAHANVPSKTTAPRWTDLHALWTEAKPAGNVGQGSGGLADGGGQTRPQTSADTGMLRDAARGLSGDATGTFRDEGTAMFKGGTARAASENGAAGAPSPPLAGAEPFALGASALGGAQEGAANKGAEAPPAAGEARVGVNRDNRQETSTHGEHGYPAPDGVAGGRVSADKAPLNEAPDASRDSAGRAARAAHDKASEGRSHGWGEGQLAASALGATSLGRGPLGAMPAAREAVIRTPAPPPEAAPISAASGWSPDTQREPPRSGELTSITPPRDRDASVDEPGPRRAPARDEIGRDAVQNTHSHTHAQDGAQGILGAATHEAARPDPRPAEAAPAVTAHLLSHLEERLEGRRKQAVATGLRGASSLRETHAEAMIPDFGRVSVEAKDRGERVDLRVTAHEAESAHALREARPAMESHLRDNQVPLGHLALHERSETGNFAGTGQDHRPPEHDPSQNDSQEAPQSPTGKRPNSRVRVVL